MTPETLEPFPFFSTSGLKPEPIDTRNKVIVLGGAYLYSWLYFYDNEFAELFKVKAEDSAGGGRRRSRGAPLCGPGGSALQAREPAALRRRRARPNRRVRHAPGGRSPAPARHDGADRRSRPRGRVFRPRDERQRHRRCGRRRARRAGDPRTDSAPRLYRRRDPPAYRQRHADRRACTARALDRSTGSQCSTSAATPSGGRAAITATVSLGQAGVVNIEREARLSGSTYDKGIMILSGFLRARFGQQTPLAMTASHLLRAVVFGHRRR